jgi:hypothetical protein
MHESQRYRDNAADCLLAARAAREPHYKSLNLSMAQAWLSLATEDAAVGDLLAKWEGEENAGDAVRTFSASMQGRSAA